MRVSQQRIGWALLALSALLVGGCHKTFRGAASQPNPLLSPTETLRDSEEITILTGDMELNVPRRSNAEGGGVQVNKRYLLENKASFTVVSRDRLRFHVQIEHKWRDWASLDSWYAYIIDDRGRRYRPEVLERSRARHIVSMWDYETRSVRRDALGNIVGINDDGHLRRQTLGSLSVFRGSGDFVFYSRDIFTRDIKRLTLVLERRGLAFAWTWRFSAERDDTVADAHVQDGDTGRDHR